MARATSPLSERGGGGGPGAHSTDAGSFLDSSGLRGTGPGTACRWLIQGAAQRKSFADSKVKSKLNFVSQHAGDGPRGFGLPPRALPRPGCAVWARRRRNKGTPVLPRAQSLSHWFPLIGFLRSLAFLNIPSLQAPARVFSSSPSGFIYRANAGFHI